MELKKIKNGETNYRTFVCPAETTFEIIGGKWRPRILWELCKCEQPMRFGELQTALDGIREKALTHNLRELENMNLINRQEFAEFPPKVEYSLSVFGETLRPIFTVTAQWITTNRKNILEIIENNPKKNWQVRKELG